MQRGRCAGTGPAFGVVLAVDLLLGCRGEGLDQQNVFGGGCQQHCLASPLTGVPSVDVMWLPWTAAGQRGCLQAEGGRVVQH